MHPIISFSGVILILSSVAWTGDKPAASSPDRASELKKLQGTWKPIEAEMSGQKLPEDFIDGLKLIIDKDRYEVHVNDQIDKGTVKIAPEKSPKELDIQGEEGPNKGKTILAIYELKDGKLKVCYALKGKVRPKEFKTTDGERFFLATYAKKS